MDLLKWLCTNCGFAFDPPFRVTGGGTVNLIFQDSRFVCPRCKSVENIPDGTFQNTVKGFIRLLEGSQEPIQKAKEILTKLNNAKNDNNLSELNNDESLALLRNWLPNTPQKLAAYIAILTFILNFLIHKPDEKIQYNQLFINQYNEYIIGKDFFNNKDQIGNSINSQPPIISPDKTNIPKVGRNDPCPCGSGKKYKKCHDEN